MERISCPKLNPLPRLAGMFILIGALAGCAGFSAREIQKLPPDGVVAKVNGVPIRRSDVDRRVEDLIRQARESSPAPSDEQIEKSHPKLVREACRELIDKAVIDQAVRQADVKVDNAAVEAKIRELDQELREDGLTVEGLRASMRLTTDRFRALVRARLAEDVFWDKRLGLKPPTPEAVRKMYDSHPEMFRLPEAVHLYEIFVPYPSDRKPKRTERRDIKASAEALRGRLTAGEAFSSVARAAAGMAKNRSDRPLGRNEGDLGWITPQSSLPEPLLKAAFKLKTGAISEVIETEDGCHILTVNERREAETIPFEKVRDRLVVHMLRSERERRFPAELAKMRKQAKIEKP